MCWNMRVLTQTTFDLLSFYTLEEFSCSTTPSEDASPLYMVVHLERRRCETTSVTPSTEQDLGAPITLTKRMASMMALKFASMNKIATTVSLRYLLQIDEQLSVHEFSFSQFILHLYILFTSIFSARNEVPQGMFILRFASSGITN
ncbi:unnamed protein product [Haemonchus placei]|uniref:Beta-lactamase domain-containing protein n=1 Tax=Haemonchus placei TaxID=6290 RepID=A0A158QLN0_HAEPC|nr:unnamed protein product [Haemonchus placei]